MSLLVKGVTNFLGLADSPASYAGQALLLPRVNAGENALEFAATPDVLEELFGGSEHIVDNFEHFTPLTVGTGAVDQGLTRARVRTGANQNSEAVLHDSLFYLAAGGTLVDDTDWDKPQVLFVSACMDAGGASSLVYTFFRYSADITIGVMAQMGFGFRYRRSGYNLYSESHEGVGVESQLASTGLSLHDRLHKYKIVHTPGVSVRFYLDDVLLTTHTTRVPAGQTQSNLVIGAENTGVNQDIEMTVTRMIHRVAW